MTTSIFSATDSALGYLYQVRVALLWALRRLKNRDDFIVSLETLDDVTFETTGGNPEELLQTKHHRNREGTLTDASQDLWKSLRVWFEGFAAGTISRDTALNLLTTAIAPNGSVAAKLRTEQRDVDAALNGLESTARSSKSESNKPAYTVFLNTPVAERKQLIERVIILDALPTIMNLDDELKKEVYWTAERKYHDAFLERIEGWWLRRALRQLASNEAEARIQAGEIERQMSDLRDQFKRDSLPIDEDLLSFDLEEATLSAHGSSTFVHQLEIIAAGKTRIVAAVRDYYRAFEQRSRWLRNDLLLLGDLDRYERRLLEEWELVFEAGTDELGANPNEETKQAAAREVLKWAERASLPIRPTVTEPFVARGSLQMLADETRIGWHPEFRDRLAALLNSKGGGT